MMMKMENKQELKKGPWKPEEDLLLTRYVETHGEGRWATVSKRSGLMRGGKSCRLRWKNYLRPNLKREGISKEEEDLIIRMHKLLGNRWALIAGRLPGRTDNEVKNYWNTHLRMKRYHEPKTSEVPESKKKKPKLSHLSQAETFKTDQNHNEVNASSNNHSSIEDKAIEQLQPDHNSEQQWLPIEGRFFEEPYYHHLPFIDSTFFIESYGVDAGAVAGGGENSSYWTEYSNDQSVTYISEDLFQV